MECYRDAPETIREAVRKRLPKTLVVAESLAVGERTEDFRTRDWTTGLCWSRSELSEEEYIASLREGAEAWDPEDPKLTGTRASEIGSNLIKLAIENPDLFESVYPLFYRLFVDRADKPVARLMQIYQALIETVRQRETYGPDELTLLAGVAAFVLGCAPGPLEYRALVTELSGVIASVRSPSALDWAVELCDALMINPCADPGMRLQFIVTVLDMAREFNERVSEIQRISLDLIRRELGIAGEFVPRETAPVEEGRRFDHLRVGINSRDEAASKRAERVLAMLFPGLRIETNIDEVCTDGLKLLARRADVFAFAWKTAAHQAYYCVKEHIAEVSRIVHANGKGSTSLVRAVSDRISGNPA